MNNTFKINWIKRCVIDTDSIWSFIPHNIFKRVGGLKFLLTFNSKLPIKLSKFHEQALLAWKLCFDVLNFSPHRMKIWNNELIAVKGKSLFFEKWLDHGVNVFK